jgi:hypothetical protein
LVKEIPHSTLKVKLIFKDDVLSGSGVYIIKSMEIG